MFFNAFLCLQLRIDVLPQSFLLQFNDAINFNSNIGAWDVSKVYDMSAMFEEAAKFTGKGMAAWDVSNVEYMYSMVCFTSSLVQQLGLHLIFSRFRKLFSLIALLLLLPMSLTGTLGNVSTSIRCFRTTPLSTLTYRVGM